MSSRPCPRRGRSPRCATVRPEAGGCLPPPDRGRWPAVRDRLARDAGLDPRLLERCRRGGLLYADPRGRTVFVCRDGAGRATGAEIVPARPGPGSPTLAPGSLRARGGFWIAAGPAPHAVTLLVESALEALAACQLLAPGLPPAARLVSAAGPATTLPRWVRRAPAQLLVCAYGAGRRGERGARALARRLPALARLRPPGGPAWNDLLRGAPPLQLPLFLPTVHGPRETAAHR